MLDNPLVVALGMGLFSILSHYASTAWRDLRPSIQRGPIQSDLNLFDFLCAVSGILCIIAGLFGIIELATNYLMKGTGA